MNNKTQVDPMADLNFDYGITPPQPSSLVSPFKPKDQEVGNAVMGTIEQRQQSLGKNTPLFKKSCGYKK